MRKMIERDIKRCNAYSYDESGDAIANYTRVIALNRNYAGLLDRHFRPGPMICLWSSC